jgi:hypothetical protein
MSTCVNPFTDGVLSAALNWGLPEDFPHLDMLQNSDHMTHFLGI